MTYLVTAALQWCPWCGERADRWGHVGFWFGWAAFLLVLAAVMWWIAHSRSVRARHDKHDRDEAEEILRERYARGEIDERTFQRAREELRRD